MKNLQNVDVDEKSQGMAGSILAEIQRCKLTKATQKSNSRSNVKL